MKILTKLLGVTLLLLSLAGCKPNASQEDATQQNRIEKTKDRQDTAANGKILIAYFSKTGNTETIARIIQEQTGGDLFQIETVTPYPKNYDETVDLARGEQDRDARPALATHVEDMDRYEVIYLGYPNWWGTMPQAMFTFLEEYDFSDKTIVPFCTHGGSALGSSESDIARLVPDARLLKGLAVRGTEVDNAQSAVVDWIQQQE